MALTRPKYSQIYDTDYKQSVRVATTEDVGNLLATGNMTNSVDGVTLNLLDRILVKDQTDAKQNGIYRVLTVGTGSNGTWGRALDANANDKITAGMTTIVSEGDTNISKTFRLATPDPIVIGSTELSFVNPFVITASAGGANTQVQFNDVNQLGGSSAFTFNKTGNVLSVGGNIVVTGSVLPSANVTYDLGSPTQRWNTGYFASNTIDLGGSTISIDPTNGFTFTAPGLPIVTLSGSGSLSSNITTANTNMKGYVDSLVSTANVNLKGYTDNLVSTANVNLKGYTDNQISTANVNLKGYVDGQITSLINGSPSTLDTLNEIAAALGNDANLSVTLTNKITGVQGNVTAANFAIITANLDMKGYVDGANVNMKGYVDGANVNMKGYVDNGLSSLSSNRINASASNVTVTASFVNVAINSSNVATFYSTGLEILTTTQSTNTITGALIVDGGAGIAGNVNAGNVSATNLTGTIRTAAQPSITSVGTLTSLAVSGSITINGSSLAPAIVNSGSAGVGNIGASGAGFNTVFARATSAQYADLAEIYASDKKYVPGTVVVFGGDKEVTVSTVSHDPAIAGVVSTNPAYLMNDTVDGAAVALQGRVPCRVLGPVAKGDRVVASDIRGVAERLDMTKYQPGCIIGKSLDYVPDGEISTIEVVVGRN
jgi:hypothetical protein